MFVHRCDRCCVYLKEIQPCRAKYRVIWAILMHKIMFPSESCNSISKGTFRKFRPFSVIAENRWPWTTIYILPSNHHCKSEYDKNTKENKNILISLNRFLIVSIVYHFVIDCYYFPHK